MTARLDLDTLVAGLDPLMGPRPSVERLTLRATVLEVVAECRRLRVERDAALEEGRTLAAEVARRNLAWRQMREERDRLCAENAAVDDRWRRLHLSYQSLRAETAALWAVARVARHAVDALEDWRLEARPGALDLLESLEPELRDALAALPPREGSPDA